MAPGDLPDRDPGGGHEGPLLLGSSLVLSLVLLIGEVELGRAWIAALGAAMIAVVLGRSLRAVS